MVWRSQPNNRTFPSFSTPRIIILNTLDKFAISRSCYGTMRILTWNIVRLSTVSILFHTNRLMRNIYCCRMVFVHFHNIIRKSKQPKGRKYKEHYLTHLHAQNRWNTFKSHDEILDNLKADIVCFQGSSFASSLPPKSFWVSCL